MGHLRQTRIIGAIGILVLIATSFALGMARPGLGVAEAQPELAAIDSPDLPNGQHYCDVDAVGVYKSRIQVHCSNAAAGTIYYFAFQGAGTFAAHINRFLALANSAYALGHHLEILYDDDSAGNPPGCSAADCRAILALELVP